MSEQRVIMRAMPVSRGEESTPHVNDRRAALFRETLLERCERIALGTAWALRPKRIGDLVPLAQAWLADLAEGDGELPETDALSETSELAGIARDLSVPTLLAAYRRGLFPRAHFGPQKWWSPADRAVLRLDDFHISTRLRSMMRKDKYAISFDRDFEGVIKGCAGRRQGRLHLTWITPHIMRAYAHAFDAGHVHSFEVWNKQGELAGGGYGVAVGRVFVIESQFFREFERVQNRLLSARLASRPMGLRVRRQQMADADHGADGIPRNAARRVSPPALGAGAGACADRTVGSRSRGEGRCRVAPRQDALGDGAPGTARTCNPQIRSLVLYPLSYGRKGL